MSIVSNSYVAAYDFRLLTQEREAVHNSQTFFVVFLSPYRQFHFNIILPLIPVYSKWPLVFRVSSQKFVRISHIPHARCMRSHEQLNIAGSWIQVLRGPHCLANSRITSHRCSDLEARCCYSNRVPYWWKMFLVSIVTAMAFDAIV